MDNDNVVDYNTDHMNDGGRMKPLNLFSALNEHQRAAMVKWWVEMTPKDSFWFHSGGQPYQVKGHFNLKSTNWEKYPPSVRYADHEGEEWGRPLHDWQRSMTRNKPEDWKGKKK